MRKPVALGRLLLLMAALLGSTAGAQTVELQPSAARQCLRHVDGDGQLPDYPFADYNAARPGRVQVEMRFSQPDRPPELRFLLQEGGERFAEAVTAYAKGLRVPCLGKDSPPARLEQDFVFSPGTPRSSTTGARDPDEQRRAAMLGCVVHAQGWRVPEYPAWARSQGIQGRVLVRATYANGSDPPTVESFSQPYASRLARGAQDWMQHTRLPCHQGEPVVGLWTFVYRFEGDQYGFKKLEFVQFLSLVKGIRQQTLLLDTNAMGCPFDVLMDYHQPQLPNAVKELGTRNPARRPLLQWMADSELTLPQTSLNTVWGDTARITIPCLKIDLKPKE